MAEATGIARDQLKSIVERIEKLEEEKKAIGDDIREAFAEATANGFDTKALRQVLHIRKQDFAMRREREAIIDLYSPRTIRSLQGMLHALGLGASGA